MIHTVYTVAMIVLNLIIKDTTRYEVVIHIRRQYHIMITSTNWSIATPGRNPSTIEQHVTRRALLSLTMTGFE